MTLFVAALALTQPQVSLDSAAQPMGEVVKTLSAQTGQKLGCAPPLADEPVIAHVRSATLADVEAKLAAAVGGVWKEVDGGLTLALDESRDRADRADYESARARSLRDLLAWLREGLKHPSDSSSQHRRFVAMLGSDKDRPNDLGTRFIVRLLSQFTDREFLNLRLDELDVKAWDSANLAPSVRDACRQLWAEANESVQGQNPHFPGDRAFLPGIGPLLSTDPDRMRRVTVSIERKADLWFQVSVSMETTDPEQSYLLPLNLLVKLPVGETPELPRVKSGLTAGSSALLRLIRWNPYWPSMGGITTASLGDAHRGAYTVDFTQASPPPPPKVDSEQRRMFLRPEQHDPLAYFVNDSLRDLAQTTDSDLIAVVDDSVFQTLANQLTGDPSGAIGDALSALAKEPTVQIEARNGWTLVTPRWPFLARDHRMSRKVLGETLRSVDQNGWFGLADRVRLAAETFRSSSALTVLFRCVSGEAGSIALGSGSLRHALLLWGQLRPAQSQGLSPSHGLGFALADPKTYKLALALADHTASQPSGSFHDAGIGHFTTIGSQVSLAGPRVPQLIDVARDGLPKGAAVAVSEIDEPGLLWQTDDPLSRRTGGLPDLALDLAVTDDRRLAPFYFTGTAKPSFRLVTRKRYLLTVETAPRCVCSTVLEDFADTADKAVYTPDTLPAEIKARLETLRRSLKSDLARIDTNTLLSEPSGPIRP